MVNDEMDFNSVKDLLQVTDGNLASHTNSLEKLEYITVIKEFVGKKPRTSYKATKAGKEAFTKHIDALEQLLNNR